MERKLAAILAADVVGYSRLMSDNEADTFDRLRAHRKELFEPEIAKHHGRIFKLMGDGLLAEFGSVVDAVECAAGLQREMARRNDGLPDNRRIQVRIGINLGDVIVEGEDRHGDGVNIAARLQELAEPGGLAVSGTAYDHLQGKVGIALEFLGEQHVQNIARPVRVYRARLDRPITVEKPTLALPDKPSIAVLPFMNMSGDPEQQYFSDGVTEDIITELSRFRRLQVLARHSSFRYRGQDVDPVRVGRELGVQFLVEGSVRRLAEHMRITAQLIDAASGHHVWAERFDCNQEDVFAIQDQVVRRIVGTLVGRLDAAGVERARRKPPASLAAYECVLRGAALPFGNPSVDAEKRRMFERAIALDPDYGLAYARLAFVVFLDWFADMTGSDLALDRAFELASKAIVLDENDSTCQRALGWMHLHRKSFELAEEYFQRALELNPNDPEQVANGGFLYAFLGKPDDAIDWLSKARRLDPYFNPIRYWHFIGFAHFIAHRYEEAIAAFSHSSTMPFWVQAYLAASYALTDKSDRAWEVATQVLSLKPDFSSTRLAAKEPFKRPEDKEHLLHGLRKAGLPE